MHRPEIMNGLEPAYDLQPLTIISVKVYTFEKDILK